MTMSNVMHLWQRYQIKISLDGIKPPIWRRVIVDSRIPLNALHEVIQITMGWLDMHLHQFEDKDGQVYGEIDPDFELQEDIIDEDSVILSEVLKQEKDWIRYEYDFGDDWSHKIVLEKILPADNFVFPIICVKGVRACPPEDVGGTWGYKHMLDVLADPKHSEHEEMQEWVGEYFLGPEHFDLDEVNEVLNDVFKGVKFSSRPGRLNKVKKESSHKLPNLDTDSEIEETIFNDPQIPDEIKEFTSQLLETLDIVKEMSELLDDNQIAFEEILAISSDSKVKKIARKMLRNME